MTINCVQPLKISILSTFKCFPENFSPWSASPTEWSDTLKQFVGSLPTNWLSVFDHSVGLALNGLIKKEVLVYQLEGVNPTYERYILGSILVNRHMSGVSKKDISHFAFSKSTSIFYISWVILILHCINGGWILGYSRWDVVRDPNTWSNFS